MRLLSVAFLFAVACTGTPKNSDSSTDTSGGTTDSATTTTDSETTTTTSTTEPTGVISGSIKAYDGTTPADITVQVCATTCYSITTDQTGAFIKESLKEAGYKVEVMGHTTKGHDYGNLRMHVELADAQAYAVTAPLYMPQVFGPQTAGGAEMHFGDVTVDASNATLKVPFGETDNTFWAGTVAGAEVPPFWGLDAPAGAVAFVPLGTEVTGSFNLAVSGYESGSYDVYSVDEHGSVEGPVGTASVEAGTLYAADLAPTILSWLIFVPTQG